MFGTLINLLFLNNLIKGFYMKGIRALCLWFLLLPAGVASAQLVEKVLDVFNDDTLGTVVAQRADTDSVHLLKMKEDLEVARLNEANLRMEIEQMRLKYDAADSLKLAKQRLRIDSLRRMTTGVPVVVEGDTLYYLFAKRGGHTPQQRAEMNAAAITELGKRFNLQPDSVYLESSDIVTDLMYGNKVLSSFTDQDGLWEGCSRDQLAAAKRKVIVDKLKVMKDEHSLWQLGKRILYFILVIIGQYLLFKLTTWLFNKLKVRIQRLKDTKLKPISIQEYELLDTQKQVNLLVFLANLLRYVVMLLQLILTVPLLFSIFPQTKDLAYKLFSYIWDPIKSIFLGIVEYVPNLFTIFVKWFLCRLGYANVSHCAFPALCIYDCYDLSLSAGFQVGRFSGDIGLCRLDCFVGFEYGDREYYCGIGNHLYASL